MISRVYDSLFSHVILLKFTILSLSSEFNLWSLCDTWTECIFFQIGYCLLQLSKRGHYLHSDNSLPWAFSNPTGSLNLNPNAVVLNIFPQSLDKDQEVFLTFLFARRSIFSRHPLLPQPWGSNFMARIYILTHHFAKYLN